MNNQDRTTMHMFVKRAFEQLLKDASGRKNSKLRDKLKGCLVKLGKPAEGPEVPGYWEILKIACQSQNRHLVETSLDAIQKFIAYGYLSGDSLVGDTEDYDGVSDIVDVVCECFTVADDKVHLQIIKALLTAVTSTTCQVHESSLLKVVRTCYNIYLVTENIVIQTTAKATLKQMLNIIFQRMEAASASFPSEDNEEKPELSATVAEDVKGGEEEEGESSEAKPDMGKEEEPIEEDPILVVKNIVEQILDNITEPQSEADKGKKEEPPVPIVPPRPIRTPAEILQRDALLTFRAMCKLSVKTLPDGSSADSTDMRSKLLALELLVGVLETAGPTFQTADQFIHAVRQYLCISILTNGASAFPPVFGHAMRLFLLVLESFKTHLKTEIGMFFHNIFLRLLESPNATAQQKWMVLQVVHRVCQSPQVLVDVFLNYDCDIEANDIYERMVSDLSREAQGHLHTVEVSGDPVAVEQAHAAMSLALECLVDVVRSLVSWAESGMTKQSEQVDDEVKKVEEGEEADAVVEDTEEGSSNMAAVDMFVRQKQVKEILEKGVKQFNLKPKKGIKYLVQERFIQSETPEDIASFLNSTQGLNKAMIGEYLGGGEPFNIAVLYAYVDQKDFTSMRFDGALRSYLSGFRLPGEAQKIDRFVEKFAERYLNDNPGVFNSADTGYVLAYSVIMLNTDLHNPMVKNKMTVDEFVANNRGIDGNEDLPVDYLHGIYNTIKGNEIIMEDEIAAKASGNLTLEEKSNPRIKRMLYELESEQMLKSSTKVLKAVSKKRSTYYVGRNAAHVRSMFEVTWAPTMASFSVLLEDSESPRIIRLCLDGFSFAIRLSAMFLMETERNAFVTSLAKFTFLNNLREMEEKNIESVRTLIDVALRDGNYLQSSWVQVIRCVSMLEYLHLIGTGARTESFGIAMPNPTPGISYGAPAYEQGPMNPGSPRSSSLTSAITTAPPAHSSFSAQRPAGSHGHKGHRADIVQVNADPRGSTEGRFSGSVPRSSRDSEQFKRVSAQVSAKHKQEASVIEGLNALSIVEKIDQVAIDRIFNDSYSLNDESIVEFIKAMCTVSLDEILNPYQPRSFCLQRIIEVAHYNMDRVRIVWSRIWAVLSEYFQNVCTNPNLSISMYATDSLRQLSMKFLEKEELEHFQFQKEFLKPFEYIYANNTSPEIRELIVRCVQQMVLARAANIRSGWRAVFSILAQASQSVEVNAAQLAFTVVEKALQDDFELIADVSGAFGDLIHSIAAFAQGRYFPALSIKAVGLIRHCASLLASRPVLPKPVPSQTPHINRHRSFSRHLSGPYIDEDTVVEDEAMRALGSIEAMYSDDETHLKMWFPVLTGLSRAVTHQNIDVRTKALDALFDILQLYGKMFTAGLWELVFKGVLFPIFDDVRHAFGAPSLSPQKTINKSGGTRHMLLGSPFSREHQALEKELINTEWLQTTCRPALQALVELFSSQYERLKFLLTDMAALLVSTALQDVESLARIGVASLLQLVIDCSHRFSESDWDVIIESIGDLFERTRAYGLLQFGASATDKTEIVDFPVETEDSGIERPIETKTLSSDLIPAAPDSENEVLVVENIVNELVNNALSVAVSEIEGYEGSNEAPPRPPMPVNEPVLDFQQVRRQCVIQLVLIQMVSDVLGKVYDDISTKHVFALLQCLEESYTFAHEFNRDMNARVALWKAGFMPSLPNLLKQETHGVASVVTVLLTLLHDEGKDCVHRNQFAEDRLAGITELVLTDYLSRSAAGESGSAEEQRDVLVWTPIVVQVLRVIQTFSDKQFAGLLARFYSLLVQLISSSNPDVRHVLVELFTRIGSAVVPQMKKSKDSST